MNIFKAYTDGACTLKQINGNYEKGSGGAAGVIIKNDNIITYFQEGSVETTNNEMELFAILMAMYKIYTLKEFNINEDKIEIYSDSAYSINCISNWAKSWEKNNWTRGKKHEEIKNLELIKCIYYFKEKFKQFELIKVRGHANNKWNNYADELAVNGKMIAQSTEISADIVALIAMINEICK